MNLKTVRTRSTPSPTDLTQLKRGIGIGLALTALSVGLGLSGCRFGNSVVPPAGTESSDPSGYYKTGVENLQFCVGTTTTTCQAASVNLLPDLARAVYTNPLIVLLENPNTGEGYVAASDRSGHAFPVLIGADNQTLAYSGATSPEILWDDPNCTTQMYLEQSGILDPTSSNRGTELLGLPLSGDVSLNVVVIQSIDGDCTHSLTAMKDCYLDSSTCGGSTTSENALIQELAQDFLKRHVDSGVLNLNTADLSQIRSLSYEINFN